MMDWYKVYQDGVLRGSLSRTDDTTQLIWLKLLAVENETRLRDGWLHFAPGTPMDRSYLATVCGVSLEAFNKALEAYLGDLDKDGHSRIEIAPDGDIFIKNWDRYQAKGVNTQVKEAAIEKAKETKRRNGAAIEGLMKAVNELNGSIKDRRYKLTNDGDILDTHTGCVRTLEEIKSDRLEK